MKVVLNDDDDKDVVMYNAGGTPKYSMPIHSANTRSMASKLRSGKIRVAETTISTIRKKKINISARKANVAVRRVPTADTDDTTTPMNVTPTILNPSFDAKKFST